MTTTRSHPVIPPAPHAELVEILGTVGRAMTRGVLTLTNDRLATDALRSLQRSGIGGAPVIASGRVVGVVTVRDLLGRRTAQATGPFLRPSHRSAAWTVGDAMTRTPITASEHEPLVDAVIRMVDARVDRLPVVDEDGAPIGLLAREDVMRALAAAARRQASRPLLLPD